MKWLRTIILFFIFTIVVEAFIFQKGNLFFREVIFQQSLYEARPLVLNIKELKIKKEEPEIRILAVGDIMLDRGVEYMVKTQGGGSWQFPFSESGDYLSKTDILFGNLESVISNSGYKTGGLYCFRAEPETLEGLTHAGFDVVSVANNHIFDYSRAAMEDSFKRLAQSGIKYVGGGFSEEEACSAIIEEREGTRIAFLGFTNLGAKSWKATPDRSGICWLDESIKERVKKAKDLADVVIVSIHWGEEYQPEPNAEQKHFGHLAIEAGANLVIGHHPHVVQPIEEYQGAWIAYSLGNFVFDQGFSEETMQGLVLEVLIKGKEIQEVKSQEIKINDFFQPGAKKTP
jgi:poly-gamma-glutamate capsule biosynthesis protein CapA/YwtB (metallophosphatase superfamily)